MIISILSLPSSDDTAWTLEPLIPTQAPTGSILPSFVFTAIFDLDPASLATPLISITSSLISGTSILKSSVTISGHDLFSINCGPLPSTSTIWRIALILSLILYISPGINLSLGRRASASCVISTIILSLVTLLTEPETSLLFWDLNCSTIFSLSASRTFCNITCLAAWVSILPNFMFSCWRVYTSSNSRPESSFEICVSWWNSSLSESKTIQFLWVEYSPVSLSICTYKSASSWKCLCDADAIAISIALKITSLSRPFSVETESTTPKISLLCIISFLH